MMNCISLCFLCGLYSVFGKDQTGKYSVPHLDVRSRQMVLEAEKTLLLNCSGRWELSWAFPASLIKDQVDVDESRCGRTMQHYCSRVRVSKIKAKHTGLFRCRYKHRTEKQASVYVYVADSRQPFVERASTRMNVLYMKVKEPLVIPCRVTDPNITTTLVKSQFHSKSFQADQRNIVWNSRQGFTIRAPTYYDVGLFYCQATVNGVRHKSQSYFVHRTVSNITNVNLNSTGIVRALKGERLVLNCTATAELNTRVNITWNYPGKLNNAGFTSKMLVRHRMHVLFYSTLTIPKLQRSDRGLYTCRVTSGDQSKQEQVKVTIYDRPFIRLKPRNGSLMVVQAGQKSYRISPKIRAFPVPEVFWFKDGNLAAEHCSRYRINGTSLVIKDVAEEDAGQYTVLVQIKEHGLYQNLTLTLMVNVSPQIAEKAVSLQDPGSVPRGSKKTLRCTSHGVPSPHFQWLWHPCPSKGLCVCPSSSSLWSPVSESLPASSAHNHILSVAHRQEVLQGRKKTVGVLTVAKAFVSGVYRCIASNTAGSDHLDIHFYITDVPGGFCVKQQEEAREGGDLHLTCLANKYLYAGLSWQPVKETGESRFPAQIIHQPTTGDFSNSLVLLLSNLTVRDSGTYRCSTRHLLTGKETHLDTQVVVTTLKPPVLMGNLTDCTVNVSSSLTLSCPSQGVPPPTITWYKDEQLLQPGSGIVIAKDGSLHIDRITTEDQGLYTCQAINERGSAETSAHIWVSSVPESSFLEIPTLVCTCVVATLFWLLLTLLIRKMKRSNSSNTKPGYLSIVFDTGEGPFEEQCERLHYDPHQWEFPREHLKIGKSLGRGAFGKVMQASAFGIDSASSCKTVAVKMLKEGATASEQKALMTELKILNHIGNHLNVVNLLGACTKPDGPLMVIVEYCRFGNLSAFLRKKRDVYIHNQLHGRADDGSGCGGSVSDNQNCTKTLSESDSKDITHEPKSASCLFLEDLISFSFQVARGMEFLASRKCIHRDLAARNVLLSENKVVKICDFGLARDIYKDPDYIRKGDARLPLKWMSPESIFDKIFTTQSDVWSYGILLWEIFSLGASPYPGLHVDEDFCLRLKKGTRMRAPEYSTPEIYSIMLACWEGHPSDRPTFTNLVETLGDLLQAKVQQNGKDYIPLGFFTNEAIRPCEAFTENPLAVTNLSYMRCVATLQTFEEMHCGEQESHDDEQSDSGMILPSEELKSVMKSNSKNTTVTRFFTFAKCRDHQVPFLCGNIPGRHDDEPSILPCGWESDEDCSPPPDHNSAFIYPSSYEPSVAP